MTDEENNSQALMVFENDSQVEINEKPSVPSVMEEIIRQTWKALPRIGDIAEGTVLHKKAGALFLDLGAFGTGVVYGKEYYDARDKLKNIRVGDRVSAKVAHLENENGYVELSIMQAGKEMFWQRARNLITQKEALELPVEGANRGGLIISYEGVKGFLPASQLSAEHYPKVEGGDQEKILEELQKLVGKKLAVIVITADPEEEKLIFSEKRSDSEETRELVKKYAVGDVVDGEVTGVVDFGVFVKVEEGLEGLVHVSELDWTLVENPAGLFSVGQKVKAKIIAIEDGKVSLSIKVLKEDPWKTAADKYKKSDIVEGTVLRLNKFGALISLEDGVYGLAHISEFGSEKRMRELVEVGKKYPVQIVMFRPEVHKLALAFLGEGGKAREEGVVELKQGES